MNMKQWEKYKLYKFAIFAKSAVCKICYFCHLQNPLSAKSIIFAICHIRQLSNFQNLPFAISAIRKNFQICYLQNPLTAKIFAKSTNRFICQPIFVKPCSQCYPQYFAKFALSAIIADYGFEPENPQLYCNPQK